MTPAIGERARAERWMEGRLRDRWIPGSFLYDGRDHTKLPASWTSQISTRRHPDGRVEHTVARRDPSTELVVRWTSTTYPGSSAVEWVTTLTNEGGSDTPLVEALQAMDIELPCPKGCRLHYARGSRTSREDFAPLTRVLGGADSHLRLTPGGGRPSSDYLPFLNVELGDGGLVIGIGWTGEWAAELTRVGPVLRARAGMDRTRFRLRPGESVRTPRILLLFWEGTDRWRGQNLLRTHILRWHTPRTEEGPITAPVLAPSWGSTPASVHEANIRTLAEHSIPVDWYWIDAEWFGASPWWKNTGNWTVRRDAYPRGLRPLSELLHRQGRRLLLWFEPHRVSEGTPLRRDHPEWLLTIPEPRAVRSWPHWIDMDDPLWQEREGRRTWIADDDAVLDLGNPDARRWLTDTVSGVLTEGGVDGYREDFNIAPLEFWRTADTADRQGITEIRWVEGLYTYWDELALRHPGLLIDNCASGSRRIDLETMGRSMPFWRTDFPCDPEAMQCHTVGLAAWVPLSATGRPKPGSDDAYRMRSAWSSSLVVFFDDQGDGPNPTPIPESYPFDRARAALEEYRSAHPYYLGDYYPLTEYSPASDAWVVYQLDRPDLGDGIVVALKRPASRYCSAVIPLRGLDHGARYEITDGDRGGDAVRLTGEQLCTSGVPLDLAEAPGTTLLRYRRLSS